MLSVVEAAIRLERSEERLLERVVGAIRTKATSKQPQHFAAVLLVEALERRYRHCVHHRHPTRGSAYL
jgi:hypothetical protein